MRELNRFALLCLGLFAVSSGVLGAPPEPSSIAPASQFRTELAKVAGVKIDDPGLDAVTSKVLLIGENHASTTTQKQIAALLEVLLAKREIDAVLVEGWCGDIDRKQLVDDFRSDSRNLDLASYWAQLLDRGELSAFEVVALRHPEIPMRGVEDMAAKLRYEFDHAFFSDTDLKSTLQSRQERLDEALALLGKSLGSKAISAAIGLAAAHRRAIEAQMQAAPVLDKAIRDLRSPENAFRIEAAAFYCDPEMVKARDAYIALEERIKKHNVLATSLRNQFDTSKGNSPSGVSIEQVNGLMTLRTGGEEIEKETQRLAAQYPTFLKRIAALGKRKEELAEIVVKPADLQGAIHIYEQRASDARFAYFEAANSLTAIARNAWPTQKFPASIRSMIDRLDLVLLEEDERRKKDNLATAKRELKARDSAMAENTRIFLDAKQPKRVALIVGYAHVPGMTEQLTERSIPITTVSLEGNETAEPWEARAWVRRRNHSSTEQEQIKEIPRLLDERWVESTRLRLRSASSVSVETPTWQGARVSYASPYVAEPREDLGEHVVEWGPVPGRDGIRFETHDHGKASELIKMYGTADAAYFYAYKNGSEYRFLNGYTEISSEEFGLSLTKRYAVVASAPDYVKRGGLVVSPLAELLASAGGGSREPPREPPGEGTAPPIGEPDGRIAQFWGALLALAKSRNGEPSRQLPDEATTPPIDDPSEPSRIKRRASSIAQTINFARASRNVAALVAQKPIHTEEVALLEKPEDLVRMPFVERDGKHAGMTVILARNDTTLRHAVQRAGSAGKLEGRQVVLITCADGQIQTRNLVEEFLGGGARMVWRPNGQVSERAGRLLFAEIAAILKEKKRTFVDMKELAEFAIERLQRKHPQDGELGALSDFGSAWVAASPFSNTSSS